MNAKYKHIPVLIAEAISALSIKQSGIYIDGTYGRGGHSQTILDGLNGSGKLIAFDKDLDAVADAKEKFSEYKNFLIVHDDFANMLNIGKGLEIVNKVDGILLDLGVSSVQLDRAERGFSFMKNGLLDMRMDTSKGVSASEWINSAPETEIADVLWQYGEERYSRRIARAIVAYRKNKKIETTGELADLISKVNKYHRKRSIHPATKSFQAIRIFINQELESLKKGLEAGLTLLKSKGRFVVISFHSLEDRIVKRFFRYHAKHEQEFCFSSGKVVEKIPSITLIDKKVRASDAEKKYNVRARSAIMRVAEKL